MYYVMSLFCNVRKLYTITIMTIANKR